ncbi:MAG: phosphate starvation-inducible protein PhoH, partial [Microthrixaceae bacterium]
MKPPTEAVARLGSNHLMATVLGPADEYLDVIEAAFVGTAVHVRGNEVSAVGPEAATLVKLFEELLVVAEAGQRLDIGVVRRTIDMVRADEAPSEVLTSTVLQRNVGGNVRPKTAGQK